MWYGRYWWYAGDPWCLIGGIITGMDVLDAVPDHDQAVVAVLVGMGGRKK